MDPIPFRKSIQKKSFSPGESNTIKMIKVPPGMNFIIRKVEIETMSEQAEQDLIFFLKAGKSILFESGKYQTIDPNYPLELRESNTIGSSYSEISSSDGYGRPDNFDIIEASYPSLYSENTEIVFNVKNQSAVYTHTIKVGISGTLIGKRKYV